MAEIKGSTLFIVGSPFQCLCMLEAINHFQLKDYDILVVYCDTLSLDKIRKLLNGRGLKYSISLYSHIIKTVLPLVFHKHRHYKNIFMGDYYAGYEALAAVYAGSNCKIHYLDDGNQALEIFSDCARKRYSSKGIAIIFTLYNAMFRLKGGQEEMFYTIYPVSSDRYQIVHNDLGFLKENSLRGKKDVYIIGTNSSALELENVSYSQLMKDLNRYIRKTYPENDIYYCPHRRDTNNENVFKLCQELGIKIYNTEISVEYDFASKGFNPSLIVGFTSNALYALRMIYSDSNIETVAYHLKDKRADESTEEIIKGMNAIGIKIIDVTNGKC